MTRDVIRQIAVVVSVVATIVVNGLANALPINNQSTGEISDRFPVYFVPAGYVFSIWGLIYLGLIAYAIYQALPAQKTNPRLRRIGWLFVLSSAANIAWIFLWHYNLFPLTMLVMLVLLGTLIAIYLRLRADRQPVSTGEKLAVMLPFSIYLGWITVATIANATSVLYDLGWNGEPIAPQAWAAIMLAAAVIITGLMLYTRRDVAYSLVIVWAAVGIAVKHSGTALVEPAAWAAAALVALGAVAVLFGLRTRGSRRAAA
jgi:translocator protein